MNTQQWLADPSRAPLVSRDGRNRVISLPNGEWVAQKFVGREGSSKTTDPWTAVHRPTTKNEALGQAMPEQSDRP